MRRGPVKVETRSAFPINLHLQTWGVWLGWKRKSGIERQVETKRGGEREFKRGKITKVALV